MQTALKSKPDNMNYSALECAKYTPLAFNIYKE